jgi:hypothetical protein
MAETMRSVCQQFPRLPLEFSWYPRFSGWMAERVHVSTFYNSMNTVLALANCRTRYAILHDFDLFPLRSDHFTEIVLAMRTRGLRFSGHELTHFDGLTDEDNQIGTWTLGIDVEWLRANWRPIDCFHKVVYVRGRRTNLDPYGYIQSLTPNRALTGAIGVDDFCHVRNLCSTYLRFLAKRPLAVAWRLHYLWYLEELSGMPGRLEFFTRAMDEADGPTLVVDGRPATFRNVHVTCANVLRKELLQMEHFLFGRPRNEVLVFTDAFERFLWRYGQTTPIINDDGSVQWSPHTTWNPATPRATMDQ